MKWALNVSIFHLRNLRHRAIKYLGQPTKRQDLTGSSKLNTGANGFCHHTNPALIECTAIISFLYLHKQVSQGGNQLLSVSLSQEE